MENMYHKETKCRFQPCTEAILLHCLICAHFRGAPLQQGVTGPQDSQYCPFPVAEEGMDWAVPAGTCGSLCRMGVMVWTEPTRTATHNFGMQSPGDKKHRTSHVNKVPRHTVCRCHF